MRSRSWFARTPNCRHSTSRWRNYSVRPCGGRDPRTSRNCWPNNGAGSKTGMAAPREASRARTASPSIIPSAIRGWKTCSRQAAAIPGRRMPAQRLSGCNATMASRSWPFTGPERQRAFRLLAANESGYCRPLQRGAAHVTRRMGSSSGPRGAKRGLSKASTARYAASASDLRARSWRTRATRIGRKPGRRFRCARSVDAPDTRQVRGRSPRL